MAEGMAYVNGEYVELEAARVPVEDRGYLFGDGVYEVVRVYRGKAFELGRHLVRLEYSSAGIELSLPGTLPELEETARTLVARSGLREAVLYIQVTRGVAPRQHPFPTVEPSLVMTVRPAAPQPAEYRQHGVAAITTRDERWGRCDLKTVNLLPNVLAKEKARRAGAYEAVLVRDGRISEGASSNVFAVINRVLLTPPRSHRILSGITREIVLEIAAERGITVREEDFPVEVLKGADEIVLTGTITGVLPVVSLDGQPVGKGRPGQMAQLLGAAYQERIAAACRQAEEAR